MYLVDEQFHLRKMVAEDPSGLWRHQGPDRARLCRAGPHLWPPDVAIEIVTRFRHTLATGEPYKYTELSEVRDDRNVREYYDWSCTA